MIKELLKKLSGDITADMARENYKYHKRRFNKYQKRYIEGLTHEIKAASKNGAKHVDTLSSLYDFMTKEFMDELKEHFEQRGFYVDKRENCSHAPSYCLRISWE